MNEVCVKCGESAPCKPWNIDGQTGVPVCQPCRHKWIEGAVAVAPEGEQS